MSKAKSEAKTREALTRKQMKGKAKQAEMQASEDTTVHLIERPKEYNVKFRLDHKPKIPTIFVFFLSLFFFCKSGIWPNQR